MSESTVSLEFTFALLLRSAWCAAILLLVVWLIQVIAARWLSPRVKYALWLLVAARLVVLWSPPSSLSLVGQIEKLGSYIAAAPAATESEPSDLPPPHLTPDLSHQGIQPAVLLEGIEFDDAPTGAQPANLWPAWTIWTLLAITWAVGTLFSAGKLLRDFWRLSKAMRVMQRLDRGPAVERLKKLESELRIRRPLSLLICERLASPAVTGVFRPALLLPRVFLDQLTLGELEQVFRHELTHVKRRDVLVNWILAWLGAVYWFFPLMRYLLSQLRRTRELACEEAVLAKASAAERGAYGKTLLRVLEMTAVGDRPVVTFTVGVAGMVWPMGNSRKESRMMQERLQLIVGQKAAGKWAMGMAIAILGMLTVVGFTDGQEKAPAPSGKAAVAAFVARDLASGVDYQWVETSYDFADTRKLFEATQMLRFAPWRAAPSRTSQPLAEQSVEGVGEVEISAQAALREWVERVIKESGWTSRTQPTITWDEGDKATISHSSESHERLTRALKALHATPESQYVFEFSFGTMDADDFGKIDVKDFRIAIDGSSDSSTEFTAPKSTAATLHSEETISRRVPSWRLILNDDQKKTLLKEVESFGSFNRLSAPKVTTLNTQSATVTTGVQRPFVTGFSRLENGVNQPRVESVFCGLNFEEQAIALGDATIWLRLKCQQTEVVGVAEEKQLGTSLTIQTPKIWQMSQSAGMEMKLGETLAIFSKSSGREDKKDEILAMFVTVREITLPPLPAAKGPEGAPPKVAAGEPIFRTRVFDVSRTPSLRGVNARIRENEWTRQTFVSPALEQLKKLITETIDPESPKVFKQSAEALTLEVTASQEVLEKVADLIKQLERIADGEKPAENTRVTVTYDVGDLFLLYSTKSTGGKQPDDLDCGNPFSHIFGAISRKLPDVVVGENGVELQPFWTNRTLVVCATHETQGKVAELLDALKKMSADEAKALIEQKSSEEARPDQAVCQGLEKRADVKFNNKPLCDALDLLGDATKVNIVLDSRALVEEGLHDAVHVSLQFRQPVTLRSALRHILDPLNLDFVVKNEGERTLIYIFSLMLPSQVCLFPAEQEYVGDSQRPCAERVQRAVLAEARFGSSSQRLNGASVLPRARLVGALILRLAA